MAIHTAATLNIRSITAINADTAPIIIPLAKPCDFFFLGGCAFLLKSFIPYKSPIFPRLSEALLLILLPALMSLSALTLLIALMLSPAFE